MVEENGFDWKQQEEWCQRPIPQEERDAMIKASKGYPYKQGQQEWQDFYTRITEWVIGHIERIEDGCECDPSGLFCSVDKSSYCNACATFGRICREYLSHNPQWKQESLS
jgi:hypothetical protein